MSRCMTLKLVTVMTVLLYLSTSQVSAQFIPGGGALPVMEVGPNLVQNTITAVQAVLIVLNQLIELTALGGILEFAEDLATIQALAAEAAALGFDLASLEAQIVPFFSNESEAFTSFQYRETQAEILRLIWQAHYFAMRTQTLIQTAVRTVEHIIAIMGHVAEAIGNLTISQSLGEAQGKLQQLAVEANVRAAAFERAKSLEGAAPGQLITILRNISDARMEDHPR
jgi:hypothetical protein